MKPTWKISAFAIVILSAIAMLLVAASAPQLMLAQAPAATVTLRATIGAGGTYTPPAPTFTPLGPGEVKATAYRMPTDHVFNGPTVTPSGPLIALNRNRPVWGGWEVDNKAVARIYAALPKSVGTVRLLTYPRETFRGRFGIAIQNAERTGSLGCTVSFSSSQQQAYKSYVIDLEKPNGVEAQTVAVGDAAVVAPKGRYFVALMRYRNVYVEIFSPERRVGDPAAFILTEQQLTDILAAIVKILEQQ
jgi:hypothetical protein